jgi:hypothetical protein
MIDKAVMQEVMEAYASGSRAHRQQQMKTKNVEQQNLSLADKLEKDVQDDMKRSNCARKLIR